MSDKCLSELALRQPYPLVFATISGAHLYGFPSNDSDCDVRGVHVLPAREVVGLDRAKETIVGCEQVGGVELDWVTHDIRKFALLMLKRNGYVLEQLYSPLVVHSTPEHEELKEIARGCITRHYAHHYLGFARTQWELFGKHDPAHVKPLLYVYRVLLTGIHLMRTGEIEANLVRLNRGFCLPYIDELLQAKIEGAEKAVLSSVDLRVHRTEYARLTRELEEAYTASKLPERPSARPGLHDLIIRLRLNRQA